VFPGSVQKFAENVEHSFRHQLTTNSTNQSGEASLYCAYPSYATTNLVVILFAISLLVQVTYVIKSFMILVVVASFCLVALLFPDMFDAYDDLLHRDLG
ncbi:hypothetical protein NP493_1253g00016, partial [Ridgeia piscesae]